MTVRAGATKSSARTLPRPATSSARLRARLGAPGAAGAVEATADQLPLLTASEPTIPCRPDT